MAQEEMGRNNRIGPNQSRRDGTKRGPHHRSSQSTPSPTLQTDSGSGGSMGLDEIELPPGVPTHLPPPMGMPMPAGMNLDDMSLGGTGYAMPPMPGQQMGGE